jgi:hypothetical protein
VNSLSDPKAMPEANPKALDASELAALKPEETKFSDLVSNRSIFKRITNNATQELKFLFQSTGNYQAVVRCLRTIEI